MITLKRSLLLVLIVASILIGGLISLGTLFAAGDNSKSMKKYDYTICSGSFMGAISGKVGEITSADNMKELLDSGWRIHSVLQNGRYLMERER